MLIYFYYQGDALRNNLLTRYFGKGFLQKPDNVDIGAPCTVSVTHGPGGMQFLIY